MEKNVSFIIPAYNAQNTILQCINALQKIPYCSEIIVIDDGSSDDTRKICESIDDIRFKYIYQVNAGVSAARNKGLQYATGDYIGFSDADDVVNVEDIQVIADALKTNSDIVMADYTQCRESNRRHIDLGIEEGKKTVEFNKQLTIWMLNYPFSKNSNRRYIGGKIYQYYYKKSFLQANQIKFDEKVNFAEDLCFLVGCFRFYPSIYYVPISIYDYYIIQGSESHKYRENFWRELQCTYEALMAKVACPELLDGIYYYYAKIGLHNYFYNMNSLNSNELTSKVREILADEKVAYDLTRLENESWTMAEKIVNWMIKHKKYRMLIRYKKIVRIIKKKKEEKE